jgi:hypothetical protein
MKYVYYTSNCEETMHGNAKFSDSFVAGEATDRTDVTDPEHVHTEISLHSRGSRGRARTESDV